MPDIDIEIKGDYSWSFEEQEWHEKYISHFTTLLEKATVDSKINMINNVLINVTYYPEKFRFKITSISTKEKQFLEHYKEDKKLRQYLVD